MEIFKCTHCQQVIYFENHLCVQCGYPLGFEAQQLKLLPLVIGKTSETYSIHDQAPQSYRYCANHQHNVCNWLVKADSENIYCEACDLNSTIPNLNQPEAKRQWLLIENAKHRLVYSLLKMGLPLMSKRINPGKGLTFDFLADLKGKPRVLTGHDNGLVTLNIVEADDVEREKSRKAMKEPYRTLNIVEADDVEREKSRKAMKEPYRTVIGHFRHEVGHYYWDRLIDNAIYLQEFRRLFGDDREDYGEALQRHYDQGAPTDWNKHFISSYASSHAWEDWAETWAHYLHIMDTLQTGFAFGLSVHPQIARQADRLDVDVKQDPYTISNFTEIIATWLPMSFAMNSINRSMGHLDLYPFVITAAVMEKLGFIHKVCYNSKV